MKSISKLSISLLIALMSINAYAITVSVKSTGKKVLGIGFKVNGTDHGGMGNSYSATDMPTGKYRFGVRAGLSDIPCVDKNGKAEIKVTQNTKAKLNYNGKTCHATLN